jgi:hypothetical protein
VSHWLARLMAAPNCTVGCLKQSPPGTSHRRLEARRTHLEFSKLEHARIGPNATCVAAEEIFCGGASVERRL